MNRNKLSVLILTQMYPLPWEPHNGIFVKEQAECLADLCKGVVFAPLFVPFAGSDLKRKWERLSSLPPLSQEGNLVLLRPKVIELPHLGDFFRDLFVLISVLWVKFWHSFYPDIIHAHFAYGAGYVGIWLARLLRRPSIITVHGGDVRVIAKGGLGEVAKKRTLKALKSATCVIAVGRELAERVAQLGIPVDKIIVIRNGVDLGIFKPVDKQAVCQELGFSSVVKRGVFIGQMGPRKRALELVMAWPYVQKVFSDSELLIVGGGPQAEVINRIINEQKLHKSIRIMNWLDREMIHKLICSSDCLMLPTEYESFGCVLLESLACGRPVVATRVGGIPEFIEDGVHGVLIENNTPEKIAEGILKVFKRTWDSQSLSKYAQTMSWPIIARKIYNEYLRLLNISSGVSVVEGVIG